MEYILLFVIGLCIGSFLHVVADRMNRDETFVRGNSYCESCKHVLSGEDMIPLFSFLYLKGKCRYCKISLSFYYPFSEIFTGIIFVLVYHFVGFLSPFSLVFYEYIACNLIIIFLSDLKYGIIPDKILFPAVIFTVLFQVVLGQQIFMTYILSAFGAGGFFLLLFVLTKGKGMGFGDVKLAFFMGLLLGFPSIIYALYIAFLTGASISLILIMWRRKKFKSTIPFGPFLVIATMIVLLFPQTIHSLAKIILP